MLSQGAADKVLGLGLMAAAAIIFVYYTLWVLVVVRFGLVLAAG
jgi:hypothetical protein